MDALLKKWVDKMGLGDWAISVNVLEKPEESWGNIVTKGQIEMDAPHRVAYITLPCDWQPPTLLHELCHVLIAETTRVSEVIGEGNDTHMQLLRDAVERDTDRLQRVFWWSCGFSADVA